MIGVGGGGNNVVNRMVKAGMKGVDFIAVNTDKQALSVSSATQKIQIGEKLTGGPGRGQQSQVGRKSAEESRNQISKALRTRTWSSSPRAWAAAPASARAPHGGGISPRRWAFDRGRGRKPFTFEGRRRMEQAEKGSEELRTGWTAWSSFPTSASSSPPTRSTFQNAFEIADDVLRQAVQSISDLISNTGFINLDFADVTAVMKNAGMAHWAWAGPPGEQGGGGGQDGHLQPLAGDLHQRCRGVLVNVTGSMDIGLEEVETAANLVQQAAHMDANIIFGAAFDNDLEDGSACTVSPQASRRRAAACPASPSPPLGRSRRPARPAAGRRRAPYPLAPEAEDPDNDPLPTSSRSLTREVRPWTSPARECGLGFLGVPGEVVRGAAALRRVQPSAQRNPPTPYSCPCNPCGTGL